MGEKTREKSFLLVRLDNSGTQKSHTQVIEITSCFQKGIKLVNSYNLCPCRRRKTISLPYKENISHGLFFCTLICRYFSSVNKTRLISALFQSQGEWFQTEKGRLIFAIKEKFFTVRVGKHWKRLPSEVNAPSLELFKTRMNGGLSNVVW